MMKKNAVTALFAVALLAGVAPMAMAKMPANADMAAPPFDVPKDTFLKQAESSNAFEIESSKLAEQKAKNADVKDFASQMIADHTKAGEALKKASNMDMPANPLSPKHAAMLDTLRGASDEDFEALYIDMQAGAHAEAVSLFAIYAQSGDDQAITAFAEKTLPTLEMHKKRVAELVAAMASP